MIMNREEIEKEAYKHYAPAGMGFDGGREERDAFIKGAEWMQKHKQLHWYKASDQLPSDCEYVLICYNNEIESANFMNGRFVISDSIELTSDGRFTWDIDNELAPIEIKWVRMNDVLELIE